MVQYQLPQGVTVNGENSVRVVVSIEEMTGTRTFMVAVQPINLTGATYELAPQQVSVVLGGPLSALNALDAATLVATVDVSNAPDGLAAPVFEVPPGLTLVSISPTQVTVTVTAEPASSPGSTLQP
jgi:hypothetical protein